MRAVVLYADGSPCPTLVLPAAALPSDQPGLIAALTVLRASLAPRDRERLLKIALVGPSSRPGYDLDYRFVQCMPGHAPEFELRGSCGHSILAAVMGARRLGCGPTLGPGNGIRVRVRNNGDDVTCTPEVVTGARVVFAARFQRYTPLVLRGLLLFGEASTEVDYGAGTARLSGVSLGNPYVFVDAARLGVRDSRELFAAGAELFTTLSAIRRAAESRLGWPSGAFPKVAAVLATREGGLAVRAISVPSWHPTLALTGVTCLAAATAIPATVPSAVLAEANGQDTDRAGVLRISTPGGDVGVTTSTTGPDVSDRLRWVAVSGKVVRFVSELDLPSVSAVARPAARPAPPARSPLPRPALPGARPATVPAAFGRSSGGLLEGSSGGSSGGPLGGSFGGQR